MARSTTTTYAGWFATLADPTRVRLLHTVATAPAGALKVGDLAAALGISQSTCSHHVRQLAEVGFVHVEKVGTSSLVSVNQACCTGLLHRPAAHRRRGDGHPVCAALLPERPP